MHVHHMVRLTVEYLQERVQATYPRWMWWGMFLLIYMRLRLTPLRGMAPEHAFEGRGSNRSWRLTNWLIG